MWAAGRRSRRHLLRHFVVGARATRDRPRRRPTTMTDGRAEQNTAEKKQRPKKRTTSAHGEFITMLSLYYGSYSLYMQAHIRMITFGAACNVEYAE